jgi:hypothetical protein
MRARSGALPFSLCWGLFKHEGRERRTEVTRARALCASMESFVFPFQQSRLGRKDLASAVALGLGLGGCNPAGYPPCFRVECPYPAYHDSYAGYIPAYAPGAPAFGEPPWDDPFVDYTDRSLTISHSTGNAQAANEALQTATPWPPYSYDARIPGNGARSVRAVTQFESGAAPAGAAAPAGGGPPGGGG